MTRVDSVFRPPGEAWQRVSPRLSTARRIVLLGLSAPLLALSAAVAARTGGGPWLLAPIAVLAAAVWGWWLIGRRVRAYGYAETDEELLITSGILLRRLSIVPYGRMQLVEVTAGPLDRMLGITTVTLHTAAATTDARIPGLPPDEAAAVRDRLAARGEQRSAGL